MVIHHALDNGWNSQIYQEWELGHDVIEDWNRIAAAYGDKVAFLDYAWFDSWWSAFGAGKTPVIVVLKKDGANKAVFALYSQGKELAAMTNSHTCYYDFIVDPEVRTEAIDLFCDVLAKLSPDKTTIEHIDTRGENFALLTRCLIARGTPLHVETFERAPNLDLAADWDSYFRSLPKNLRDNIKNCRNKVSRIGTLSFEAVDDGSDLDRHLDIVFEVEGKGWKGRSGSAIKSNPDIERFYRSLARQCVRANRLMLRKLLLDGQCIAADYSIKSGNTVFLVKTGYDEAHGQISPGLVLRAECLKELCGRPDVATYNFLGACDPWKLRWTKRTETHARLSIYPRSLRGRTRRFREHGWKELLKRSATVRRVKRWLDERRGAKPATPRR